MKERNLKMIRTYTFKELKRDAKVNALSHMAHELQIEKECDIDFELENELKRLSNLDDFTIDYSLSHSQGDGVCFFDCENILSYKILKEKNVEEGNAFEKYVIKTYKNTEQYEEILDYLNEDGEVFIAKIYEEPYSRYSHLNTCTVWYEGDNDFISELCKELKIYVYNPLCITLEKFGYDLLDISKEEVIEYAESRGAVFLKDGSYVEYLGIEENYKVYVVIETTWENSYSPEQTYSYVHGVFETYESAKKCLLEEANTMSETYGIKFTYDEENKCAILDSCDVVFTYEIKEQILKH